MTKSLKILVANGVNLDLLGKREPDHYGSFSLAQLETELNGKKDHLASMYGFKAVSLEFFQSNIESDFLAKLSESFDGALINPGAWTHTSLALADRLRALPLPFCEVHISNIAAREDFRKHSHLSAIASGVVSGLGVHSYVAGLCGLLGQLVATANAK